MFRPALGEGRTVEAIRWLARLGGVVVAAVVIGVWLSDLLNGSAPGILTLVLWADVFFGLACAFFWEGLGGTVEALSALTLQAAVVTVIPGSRLDPVILLFVFDGLAFLFCRWRRHALHHRYGR